MMKCITKILLRSHVEKYFVDSIDSCDHVVEINTSEIGYTIEQSHKGGEHSYSLPPKTESVL